MSKENGILLQGFAWDVPQVPHLWTILKEQAEQFQKAGITAVWIPPAYKGSAGNNDVGYGVYDLYDLGEFLQKGSVETRYGTKEELLSAIESLHDVHIDVYADIVLDHKMGADATETILATTVDERDRCSVSDNHQEIEAWTLFTFSGRNDTYSSFHWNWDDFHGIDYDQKTKERRIYRFIGKHWDSLVDSEYANYDYLMGADIDFSNPEVVEELHRWGSWFLKMTHVDGFRIDALKHIQFTFYQGWLKQLRKESGKELFTVGEYWSPDVEKLLHYLEVDQYSMSLFDVPLHYHFYEASRSNGNYDLSRLLENTLVARNEYKAVTFVDNHDTQPGQSLQSWILAWFRPLAYAVILLRTQGYPCVFWNDYQAKEDWLLTLMSIRKKYAYGDQHDYFDDPDIVGWTREGNSQHPEGLAVVLSDRTAGDKRMLIGKSHIAEVYVNVLHPDEECVIIDEQGEGLFHVGDGSLSVYIPQSAIENFR